MDNEFEKTWMEGEQPDVKPAEAEALAAARAAQEQSAQAEFAEQWNAEQQ